MKKEVENLLPVLTIWDDDTPEEIVHRLKLALSEFGIKLKKEGSFVDCKIYRLVQNPRLDDEQST